jgi:hypothetical protein
LPIRNPNWYHCAGVAIAFGNSVGTEAPRDVREVLLGLEHGSPLRATSENSPMCVSFHAFGFCSVRPV